MNTGQNAPNVNTNFDPNGLQSDMANQIGQVGGFQN